MTGAQGPAPTPIRIAAVADVHVGRDSVGALRPGLAAVRDAADLLLVAGDLTQHGAADEGEVLARELADLGLPIVAVLGNHDYHLQQEERIRASLEAAGVTILEADATVVRLDDGRTIGVAGVKGFGGGFAGACGSEFGEEEMKSFIRHTKRNANQLRDALAALSCDVRIALLHYAPVPDTLVGERLEIYPFLGSYLLADAIDAAGCDLVVHGHAHRGSERGLTPGGVPVRNVARPVLRASYRVYSVEQRVREGRRAAVVC